MPGMGPAPPGPSSHNATSDSGSAPALAGSYVGHALAGGVFMTWGIYVCYAVVVKYLNSSSYGGNGARKRAGAAARSGKGAGPQPPPFSGLPWYPMAAGPGRCLEPAFKAFMGVAAACVELRFSAACNVPEAYRWAPCWPLYTPDGRFEITHMNNWQHALMYGVLALSGFVDLAALRWELPAGTEQAGLVLGFLCATLMMGLHGKHHPMDQEVHFLLMLSMAAVTATAAAEALLPRSFPLAAARPLLLLLVGSWFVEIGRILFLGLPAWPIDDHAAKHMVPAVYVLHILVIAAAFLAFFLVLSCAHARGLLAARWATPADALATARGRGGGGGGAAGGWEAVAAWDEEEDGFGGGGGGGDGDGGAVVELELAGPGGFGAKRGAGAVAQWPRGGGGRADGGEALEAGALLSPERDQRWAWGVGQERGGDV
ncbi:hypothetical protein Rsub_07159 [Raphidocelis subcapitata]|uniref:Uncharacterized protein n=1 Tax=Raphidocelis subcapitata TaxID=307507 RepID=A0A2V0P5H0_9CHLO|nr:hypothetical protein Rsub_07159 [Raphidocelis subcapitata]|eukprot:GBF94172.1 hypothetical protein Rsub_07159 [Raphidocelis subcapitata]